MEAKLGRLIHSLKEKCECGSPLQLRARKVHTVVRGEELVEEEEYKSCPRCGLEVEIPIRDRKKRVEHFDKTKLVKEPVDDKKRRSSASDNKQHSVKSGDAKTGRTSHRSGSR